MPKSARKLLRVTAVSACAAVPAMSVDPRWSTSVQSTEMQHESHTLALEIQAAQAYLHAGTNLWPH